jgi:hypothetical protein
MLYAQVVSCLGPSFSDPALTSEVVDLKGNLALFAACEKAGLATPAPGSQTVESDTPLISFSSAGKSSSEWSKLDDSIMVHSLTIHIAY